MTNQVASTLKRHGPITVVTLALGLATMGIAGLIPGLSALLLSIVLGAVVRNFGLAPASISGSVAWSSKKLLRLGIVLLGFKLSLASLGAIGVQGVIVLIVTVSITFLGTVAAGRALRVSRVMRMLVAAGFSICGASAVAAMSSVVDPEGKKDEDTAQAIALVTIFGTIVMFALPALVPLLGMTDLQAGVWIGASVHEVAQVVAAGGMVSAIALMLATVAKLGRVVLLAPLIVITGLVEQRHTHGSADKRPPILPLFVAGFLAAVLMRTFIPMPDPMLCALEFFANLLLASAMLGLGYGVDVRKLIATGWRPLALGGVSTVIAAVTALAAIHLTGL